MPKNSGGNPPIELDPPDIAPHSRGNTGIPYVSTFDSGVPGPHVMVNALTHGNEYSGAQVVCRLLEGGLRPARGRLTLSFANYKAFARFDPATPYASRHTDEDLNRVWAPELLEGAGGSWELRRARELRPLVEDADFLLDLHSMHTAAPALLLTGLREKSLRFATGMGYPARMVIDEGHQAGRRMRDFGEFDDPASASVAILVESGQHWARTTLAAAYATTLRFLGQLEVAEPERLAALLPGRPTVAQRVIQVEQAVTVASPDFRFARLYRGLEVIARKGTVIAHDGGKEIATPFPDCVLVMPAIASTIKPGQTAVRLGRYLD